MHPPERPPPVHIRLFRWAGRWGPFHIRVPCGECALTSDIIADVLKRELAGIPVRLETRDWLSEWWRPLFRGGWHAPIVMVEGKIISQGAALNRGLLAQAVIEAHAGKSRITRNVLFGKQGCPHCERAKAYLHEAGIDFEYRDVVTSPVALYEMLVRTRAITGAHTPITVPQIWLDGRYIGGATELGRILHRRVEANPERGQCSLSSHRTS